MLETTRTVSVIGSMKSTSRTQWTVNGKTIYCSCYRMWSNMLKKVNKSNGTVRVCPEWLVFENFKLWFEENYKEDYVINMSVYGDGTIYSPETTTFVSKSIHYFLKDTSSFSGKNGVIGAVMRNGKYHVRCLNPFALVLEHIGYFSDPVEAKEAFLDRKRDFLFIMLQEYNDTKLVEAIKRKFEKIYE